jgi:pimeloyl-ACP methyl ester carboxylesterase
MSAGHQAPGIRHTTVMLGGAPFHVAEAGDAGAPIAVLLHGFPECWYSWRSMMGALAPHFHVLAPDLRGYHESDIAAPQEAYTPAALCADILALLDHYGATRCVLVGHDWGGLLAWFFAALHPQRVARLVILNAPHPNRFQRALDHDPAQRAASQYIDRLRDPQCADRLMAGGAQALWDMTLGGHERSGAMNAHDKSVYMEGWRKPGTVNAMLNWYRAAPFVLAAPEASSADHQHLIGQVNIAAPTLLIWGMRDDILLPQLLEGLERHVPQLEIERIDDGGHGVMHEQPQLVNALVGRFLLAQPA